MRGDPPRRKKAAINGKGSTRMRGDPPTKTVYQNGKGVSTPHARGSTFIV